ncbi:hypothetical protein NLZ15_10820 [Atlantibacter subterranea]|uniref:hypothetical protein n=1 Tax=Atlantibacter subterraneus TaxID=255519 RepID=UPI0020C40B0B|nr:hypothetical protein [Atlantibacter subterranea]UTJ49467.1 hypothetical protein NLZ15_10820 [Atlantibacter subterranea]
MRSIQALMMGEETRKNSGWLAYQQQLDALCEAGNLIKCVALYGRSPEKCHLMYSLMSLSSRSGCGSRLTASQVWKSAA